MVVYFYTANPWKHSPGSNNCFSRAFDVLKNELRGSAIAARLTDIHFVSHDPAAMSLPAVATARLSAFAK